MSSRQFVVGGGGFGTRSGRGGGPVSNLLGEGGLAFGRRGGIGSGLVGGGGFSGRGLLRSEGLVQRGFGGFGSFLFVRVFRIGLGGFIGGGKSIRRSFETGIGGG